MADNRHAGEIVAERYQLVAPLGQGGFGSVWTATRLNDGRRVALKFLKPGLGRGALRRFAREAAVLSRIEHPNCVEFIDFDPNNKPPVLVNEVVEGQTLREWAKQPHEVDEIVEVAGQIATGLQAAHQHGVIHRDLKPDNILLAAGYGRPTVKLLDFGLAKLVYGDETGDITKTGEIFGTPGFMSPEQLRGHPDIGPPADLYCLGVIMFELLEGRQPFRGRSSIELGMAHLLEPVPPLSGSVPPHLANLVSGLLQKEPSDRPTITTVLKTLSGDRGPRAQIDVPQSDSRFGIAMLLGIVIVGILAAAWWSWPDDLPAKRIPPAVLAPPPPPPPATSAREAPSAPEPPAPVSVDRSLGCGKPHPSGRQPISVDYGARRVELLGHIPDPYDPEIPHPVIVLLHEAGQGSDGIMDEVKLGSLADAEGIILLAPQSEPGLTGYWADSQISAAWFNVTEMQEVLCIDSDSIFVLGHGTGGYAAHRLVCKFDGVAAVATASHRATDHGLCVPETPVPLLSLSPIHDVADPVKATGQRNRRGGVKLGLGEHDELLRKNSRCDESEGEVHEFGTSRCISWACESPLTSCHVDGGRHWPGSVIEGVQAPPSDFSYAEVIWNFFESRGERVAE